MSNIEMWKSEFDNIMNNLKTDNIPYVKGIYGSFYGYAPNIEFITLDALKPSEWENGIKENSIYITFRLDLNTKTINVLNSGHVWISDKDKEKYPNYKYYAMHSMMHIAKMNKCKGIRKKHYKNAKDASDYIKTAFVNVMELIDYYTNGYPYSKGVNDIIKI